MRNRVNNDIRVKAKKQGIRLWEIADRYGLTDGNFSRLLRRELQKEKRERILAIIDELTERGEV